MAFFPVIIINPQLTEENEITVVGFITRPFLPHISLLISLYLIAESKSHLRLQKHRNPVELVFSWKTSPKEKRFRRLALILNNSMI